MIDIIGKRYIFFGLSLLIIIPGLIVLAIWGFPLVNRLYRRLVGRSSLRIG